jgi:hypothetical protein
VTDKLERLDCLALVGVAGHEAAVFELAPVLPLTQNDPEELPLPQRTHWCRRSIRRDGRCRRRASRLASASRPGSSSRT